ncbi:MAG TPA: transcription antitermination factor NusB [Terriglobales bacterium]|nr:transcription antitermination factor NusB [Terriglobales bacterium]
MPVSPARVAAFDILLRVEATDAYASELLHSSRTNKLSPADHGLATEIVMGVLRWRSVLDEQIAVHVNQRTSAAKAANMSGTPSARLQAVPSRKDPLYKLDIEVITALRIGAYQLLFLDRIPVHAAINESVELVKKVRKRSAAGMVNAVLRRLGKQASPRNVLVNRGSEVQLREGIASAMPKGRLDAAPLGGEAAAAKAAKISGAPSARLQAVPSRSAPAADPLSQEKSPLNSRSLDSSARDDSAVKAHPSWLVQGWEQRYGAETAQAICGYDQSAPETVIHADRKLVEELATEKVGMEAGRLLKQVYTVVRGDLTRTRAFRDKRLVIQDEGSQLIALLFGHGQRTLDCCAAPGGKTRIIGEQNPQATVIATELHPHRAALMRKLVPLPNVHVIAADVRTMPFAVQFDRILVDAPCTGTGTLARNPEIKWRLKPDDISRLQAYQLEILAAAMKQLAPGGQLLYSTCSLEPEENEAVIEQALHADHSFRLLDIRDRLNELRKDGTLVCDPDSLVRGPYLRTFPGVHPCDGFFAALLQREM